MRSLIVCESLFGNTKAIADAIAEGLRWYGEAHVVTAEQAVPEVIDGIDLLVVGAPTHAWGIPRARTWAADSQPVAHHGPFIRDWLDEVPDGYDRPGAAFATRLDKPRLLTGTAANGIARRLRDRGWREVVRPRSFLVTGTEGPLADGELEEAKAWGRLIGAVVSPIGAGVG